MRLHFASHEQSQLLLREHLSNKIPVGVQSNSKVIWKAAACILHRRRFF